MKRPLPSPRLSLLCLFLAATGCGTADRDPAFIERDSAGVTIAESTAPAWLKGEGWQVADEPLLELGGKEHQSGHLFDRVLGARRLPDGRIVVVDGGSATLRWFSAEGRFLFQRGGWGGGPSEFELLSPPLSSPGPDAVVVLSGRGRYALFDTEGRRSDVRVPPSLPYLENPARLPDGAWVAWPLGRLSAATVPERYPRALVRIDPDGSAVDTLAVLQGIGATGGTFQIPVGMQYLSLPHYVFGGQTSMTVVGEALVLATAADYQVNFHDGRAEVRRIVRWAGPDLTVSAQDRSAYVAFREKQLRDAGVTDPARLAAARSEAERGPYASHHAAYGRMHADPAGRLWLRDVNPPGVHQETYSVLDTNGRLLGDVAMPEGFRTFQIGPDWVLGLWRDALDVEHVRLHALLR